MHTGSKLIRAFGISMFLSVNVQAMIQEYQEHRAEKQEVIRIFPQFHLEELALMALNNSYARNMYFMELIYEGMVENNSKKIQDKLKCGLKRNFDVNAKDYLGNTLLHHAVVVHNSDCHNTIISLLIENGADINCGNNVGSTPLCVAAMLGKLEAATQLIAYGADVNVKDNCGWSPLEYAIIINGNRAMVQLLLEVPGINVDQKTAIEALQQRAKRIEYLKNVDPKTLTEAPAIQALFTHWIVSLNELNYMLGAYFDRVQKGLGCQGHVCVF